MAAVRCWRDLRPGRCRERGISGLYILDYFDWDLPMCHVCMYVFLSKCIVMSCMQVPGSHQLELSPQRLQVAAGRLFAGYGYAAGDPQRLMPNCTVLCGPAGSATLIDTRIWHVSAVSYWRRCKPPQYMHA